MRILYAATSTVPSSSANSLQVLKSAQAFLDSGHQVKLVLPARGPVPAWEDIAVQYGLHRRVTIQWVEVNSRLRGYDFAWRSLQLAREFSADILYGRALQATALASLLNQRTVLELHDVPTGWFGPQLLRLFLLGRGAVRLVVTTRGLRAWIEGRYDRELREPFGIVAPNGVDLDRYSSRPLPSEARSRLDWEEAFTVSYTGQLYAGRGVGLIFDLASLNPDLQFVLAGGIDQDVKQRRMELKQRGLRNVKILGHVPNIDLPLIHAASEVLLMPYQPVIAVRGEGGEPSTFYSPLKMFEYLAAGRAILSSDLPSIREVLDESVAYLLPSSDIKAWDNALKELHADREKCQAYGQRARELAEKYSWKNRTKVVLKGLDG